MNLSSYLNGGGADRVALHREEAKALREWKKGVESRTRSIETALGAVDALKRCDVGGGFGSDAYARWFFVRRYETGPGDEIASLDCVVVPEAVEGGFRHRPKPHDDPAKAASGAVTMTPTPVTGREIAEEAAAHYAGNVLVGTYEDVLVEPCRTCGGPSPVICEHYFDLSNEHQWIMLQRLCIRCPLLVKIASSGFDLRETPPFLPPATPPQQR
jgi:hypothetical protein